MPPWNNSRFAHSLYSNISARARFIGEHLAFIALVAQVGLEMERLRAGVGVRAEDLLEGLRE